MIYTLSQLHMVIGITHRQKQSPRGALQKGAPGNFTRTTGKHPCQSLSFNKTAGRRPASLLEKRRQHWRPLVNSVKSPRTPSFYRTPTMVSGGCFYTKTKSSLIFSLISSMRNCKTKLWKEMEVRARRKGEIWMQATFRSLFLRNVFFLLFF